MTAFKVTSTNSIATIGDAFTLDSPAADSLTVDVDAFIISTGPDSDASAVFLGGTAAWTSTINGTLYSAKGGGLSISSLTNGTSKVTIGANGTIGGFTHGIAAGEDVSITNNGTVFGRNQGISLGGKVNTIVNNGTINDGDVGNSVAILLGGGNSGDASTKITNNANGRIDGIFDISEGYAMTITNSGLITSGITIRADVAQTISNSGSIIGDILLGNGTNTITNSSKGAIDGQIEFGTGKNVLNNAGRIDAVLFENNSTDIITNSGKLTDDPFAVIETKGGNDVFKNTSLTSITVNMGEGEDQFTGGNGSETVIDAAGADKVSLGGGDDTYNVLALAGDGTDTIDAGAGTGDFYNAAGAGVGVNVNLDTVAHNFGPVIPGLTLAANTATQGADKDVIKNFEVVLGSNFNDHIAGNAVANLLGGGDGIDVLFGYGSNDFLAGGNGNDHLFAGTGKDKLSGGFDADVFHIQKASDSTVAIAGRDVITDFEDNTDFLSFALMDANTKNGSASNESFSYIGNNQPFTVGNAGQLRSYWTVDGFILEGDTNGDARADFAVEVLDSDHSISWVPGSNLLL